ncbi:hypothetical protein LZ30DRAFT_693672 [Colletotrichum cereale]|nr:hypothetical protein LZ30DRAFT_693672 [Colletotrichum cereale]
MELASFANDPNVPSKDISTALKAFQFPGGPYVHPLEISFPTGKVKETWRGALQDAEDRDIIANFLIGPHDGRQCWIGFFSGPAKKRVGSGRGWMNGDWHCFTAMVVPNKNGCRGKNLLIYNNDAKEGVTEASRISWVLWGMERSLWAEATKRGGYTVWYSTDRTSAGSGRCLFYALQQAQQWSGMADTALEEDDPRVSGFVKLTLK